MQILKFNVKSVCPVCFKPIQGEIVENRGKVYLLKSCDRHGHFKGIVESDSEFYKSCLNSRSCTTKTDCFKLTLPISKKCNLNCKFCYYPIRNRKEITFQKIYKLIANYPGEVISISGGEPTLREDVFEIIKCIKKLNKFSNLSTNGLRLADEDFVKKLKEAGLNVIHFSLNGLSDEVFLKLHRRKLLDLKLKALKNIKKYNIITDVSFLIQKINEGELQKVYNYSLKNSSFIKSIRIRTPSPVGRYGRIDSYYTSDILKLVCKITGISYHDIIKKISRIKEGKKVCNINFHVLVYNKNKPKTIHWHISDPKKKLSLGPKIYKIIRLFTGDNSKIDYNLFYKLVNIVKVITMLRNPLLIKYFLKRIFKGGEFVTMLIGIRCWPNKWNIDMELIEMCPSVTLNWKDEMMPFCYSHIYNEFNLKNLKNN